MKDIFAIVTASSLAVAESAARLAVRHQARLTVYLVQPEVDVVGVAMLAGGPGLDEHVIEERAAQAEKIHHQAAALLDPWVRDFRWFTATDGGAREMLRRARLADLVVIGQSADGGDAAEHREIAELLTGSGRPIMVVPAGCDAGRDARRVLISWNGTAQVTRAVHDALPILVRAEAVHLLLIAAALPGPGAVPGEDLCDHLRQHGVETKVQVVREQIGRGVDAIILDQARSLDADLIVMGAFGGPRLRDSLLGGVTSAVLAGSAVPLFLAG